MEDEPKKKRQVKKTDRQIAAIAEGQYSLVTRAQMLEKGVSRREIQYRVRQRRLHVVHPGIYRMPGVKPSFEQQVMAACLATGGVASHRAAATLFKLRGIASDKVEVTVDRHWAARIKGVTCRRSMGIETTTIGGIPVTMPAQILLDVAAVEPSLAEGALADALARHLVRLPQMVRFLGERSRSGRPGCARLRKLVEQHVRGVRPTESWLEDRLLDLLRRYGFPDPERQYSLLLPGRRKPIRFDLAYPIRKGAVEADSRLWHSSPVQQELDRQRDEATSALGWTVERVTWLQLVEAPADVARRIGLLLGWAAAA